MTDNFHARSERLCKRTGAATLASTTHGLRRCSSMVFKTKAAASLLPSPPRAVRHTTKQHLAQTSLPGSVRCSAAPASSSFPLAEKHGSLSRSTQGPTRRQKLNEMAQFNSSLPIHCVEKFLTFSSRQICALHTALPVENSFLPAPTPVPLTISASLPQPFYPLPHHQHPKMNEATFKHFCNLDQFNQTRLGVITQVAPEGNLMQQGLLAQTSILLTQFLPPAQPELEKARSHLQPNNCFLKLTCKSQIRKHVGFGCLNIDAWHPLRHLPRACQPGIGPTKDQYFFREAAGGQTRYITASQTALGTSVSVAELLPAWVSSV